MSELHESITVRAAIDEATTNLQAFFAQYQSPDEHIAILPLRISIPTIKKESGLNIEKNVKVSVREAHRTKDSQYTAFDINWEVEPAGPYPYFSGTLSIAADEPADKDAFRLLLDGTYVAPFGNAGRLFDATIGHAIGRATILDLLERMRDFLQRPHHGTE